MIDEAFIHRIHDSGKRFVLFITGGGTRAVGELLSVPGGSKSLLECVVPYSAAALRERLGGQPDQYCSEHTARAMAMAAFERARCLELQEAGSDALSLVGIGCTASLTSDRPKRSPHRIHVAWQTAEQTAAYSLELTKGARTRREEEEVCAKLVLAALGEAAGLDG